MTLSIKLFDKDKVTDSDALNSILYLYLIFIIYLWTSI